MRAVEDPRNVPSMGCVATKEPMWRAVPKVAHLRNWVSGYGRDLIRCVIRITLGGEQELIDFPAVKTGEAQIKIERLQVRHLEWEQFKVPVGFLMRPVVHQAIAPLLRGRQALRYMDRH